VVTRLPWLPETDDACVTEIDQDAAEVFGAVSGDYVPRFPDAPPKVADVDKPLTDTAKSSRRKASASNSDPGLFGNWKATSARVDDEQPPVDDAYVDFMGEQVDDTEEEVF
jgi:hypothetical protein